MKRFFFVLFLALLTACATHRAKMGWRVRDIVLAPSPTIHLMGPNQQVVASVSKLALQQLLLSHFRVTRVAEVQAELLIIVDGDDPNAFAGLINGRPAIGVNLAMLKLVGDDVDELASLLGHEAAHLAKGHGETGRSRESTLKGIGTLLGMGLGAAGVPAAGTLAGLAVDLVDSAYSREEEREADSLGVTYAISAGYDPYGAVRLHEKLLKASGGTLLPFLSSHPSGEARIESLKALIEAKKEADPKGESLDHQFRGHRSLF